MTNGEHVFTEFESILELDSMAKRKRGVLVSVTPKCALSHIYVDVSIICCTIATSEECNGLL